MGMITNQKHVSRNDGMDYDENEALNDANAYLLGISQLNAELDVLSNNDAKRSDGHVNITSFQTQDTNTNMQKLDDALLFLCKIADIKVNSIGQYVISPRQKSPLQELDEALDFLCKIADIDISKQPETVVQKSVELVPMMQVQPDENDDDIDWDEFVKERVACRPVKEKKKAGGKVRKFFRRLIGKK